MEPAIDLFDETDPASQPVEHPDATGVGAASALIGAAGMIVIGGRFEGTGRLVALGLSHTAAFTVAAVVLAIGLRARTGTRFLTRWGLVAAGLAVSLGLLVFAGATAWGPETKLGSLLVLVVFGGGAGALYLWIATRLGMLRHRPGEGDET